MLIHPYSRSNKLALVSPPYLNIPSSARFPLYQDSCSHPRIRVGAGDAVLAFGGWYGIKMPEDVMFLESKQVDHLLMETKLFSSLIARRCWRAGGKALSIDHE